MKRNVTLILVMILCLMITSCHFSKFKKADEIKQNVSSFDIEMDFNGTVYEFAKTSAGYYLGDQYYNNYVYYNFAENRSYLLDHDLKQKSLLNTNYDFTTYLDNIYKVLTIHLSSKKISKYNQEKTTYLNRNVVSYQQDKKGILEEFIIDDETGACLYYHYYDGDKQTIYQVNKFLLDDHCLDIYDTYKKMIPAEVNDLPTKEEIEKKLTTYDLTLVLNEMTIHLIKDNQGIYFEINENNKIDALLYDFQTKIWYDIYPDTKTKALEENEPDANSYENDLLAPLFIHLNRINSYFQMNEQETYLQFNDVILYNKIYGISKGNTEYYKVTKELGICVEAKIISKNVNYYYELKEIKLEGSTKAYFDYQLVSKPYKAWPKNHPFLEGIDEIKFGKFVIAEEIDNSLKISYTNISYNDVLVIVSNMKQKGFNLNIEENRLLDERQNISFYSFKATRSDGMILDISFIATQTGSLDVVFTKLKN